MFRPFDRFWKHSAAIGLVWALAWWTFGNRAAEAKPPERHTVQRVAGEEDTRESSSETGRVQLRSALSIEDLEQIALQNNPTLRQAAEVVQEQRGFWKQSGLYPNPTAGYLRSDPSSSRESQKQGGLISQTIITGGKLQLSRAAESQQINNALWELEAQRMRVLNDLRIRYYEVLGAQASKALTAQLLQVAEQGEELVDAAVKAKTASRADLLQVRIQRNGVRMAHQDAQYRYHAAWQQLAIMAGTSGMPPTEVRGNLREGLPELNEEESLQQLFASSPQLRAAEALRERAKYRYQRERVEPIPDVSLQGVAEYDRMSRTTTFSTLVAIPVPVFNRNQGNITAAFAEIQQASAEIERVRLTLQDQLAAAFRRYRTAMSQIERYEAEIVPDARESLELTQLGFKAGELALLNVLIARQTYFQTNVAYVDALTELRKVEVEINGLLLTGGGLNPAAIGGAIQNQQQGGRLQLQGLINQQQQEGTKQFLRSAAAQQTGG